jgi:signal transduction histidine kinase
VSSEDDVSAHDIIEDVSDRERRMRAQREFVANAAHELITPLTGIVSAAHVLESGAKEVPEDRDRFIAHIAHECARLTRIARALLVLARAQSGEEPPRLEIVGLRGVIDEVVAITTSEQPVEISVNCVDDVSVLAEADLLTQGLLNLVMNAVRHGSGEEIVIEVSEVDGTRVVIDVVDREGSLDAADLEALHRRFRSGRHTGGFGLGLSIAQQSLEAIGGNVRFELDEGFTARVEIPSGRVDS